MPISPAISKLIVAHKDSAVIVEQAGQEGVINLRRAALQKVCQGVTSLAEMNRVL